MKEITRKARIHKIFLAYELTSTVNSEFYRDVHFQFILFEQSHLAVKRNVERGSTSSTDRAQSVEMWARVDQIQYFAKSVTTPQLK